VRRSTDPGSGRSYVRDIDPDLVITVLFVCEVVLAALVFAFFVLHEAHKGHAATASAPESRNRRKGIG